MLYTRKGDKGDTSFFGCNQRFLKNSALVEALGSIDEINSLLGICKAKSGKIKIKISGKNIFLTEIIEQIQQDLFIIQANLAGADKKITAEKVKYLENIIDEIEKQLPLIKNFFVSGGSELSALFDYSRAVSRRAERKAVALAESGKNKTLPRSELTIGSSTTGVTAETLAFLNRLSSVLYAIARILNFKAGKKEKTPLYR